MRECQLAVWGLQFGSHTLGRSVLLSFSLSVGIYTICILALTLSLRPCVPSMTARLFLMVLRRIGEDVWSIGGLGAREGLGRLCEDRGRLGRIGAAP